MGPVERMVRRHSSRCFGTIAFAFLQSMTPHQIKIAGKTNEPMTVTIGDIEGFDALIMPPIASNTPMAKQTIDPIRILFNL